jgi:surface protein
MFSGCILLESLNLFNFNTIKVKDMANAFAGCSSLKSINLSSFNTINVENMNSMFSGCILLESLNLFSFNVIKVKDMSNMFSGCSSLKSINLSNFFTDNLENMNSMFAQCISIESIILFNFNTLKVKDMAKIFEGCRALKSIDLSNFVTKNTENMNSMFSQCTALESLNLSNFDTTVVQSMDYMFYNCSSLSILDISNFNFLQSSIEQIFFGLINLSYINLYNVKDNKKKIVACTLNTDTNIEKIFYVCQQEYLITNTKSLDCCDYYDNEAHCDFNKTTNNNNIAISKEIMNGYNNILLEIEDKNYQVIQTENMVLQFSTVNDQLTNTSNMVSSIDLGECEDKLREQEGLNETEEFLMIKLDIKNKTTNATLVQYEIFNPRNFSKVSLDVCKNITIKITVPVILAQTQLSLISNVEGYGYNVFDINDDFYNDVCSLYTAENGADMVLSSRKNRIYDSVKEINLCQEGCQFSKFDTNTSKAECNCNVQTNETETDVSKLSFGKSEFFDNFYSTLFNSNFRVIKCANLMFSLKGMKSNYGFYVMTFLLVSFIAFIIVHLIVGQTRIINIINNILKSKGISENNDNNKNNDNNQAENKEPETENKIKREIDIRNNMDRPETKDDLNADIKIEDLQAPVRRRNQKIYKPKKTQFETKKDIVIYNTTDEINDKIEEKENKKEEDKNAEKVTQKASNDKKEDAIEQYKDLTDEEKNELDYEVAIIVDKRTFWQYYISLLKREHLIIFTFITADDYNLRQIKILLFIVSFALFFAINAFFFGDDTMDKIYEDNGIFKILFQLPQILYSSVISSAIDMILHKLSISEEQILEMKKEKDIEKCKQKANKVKNTLKLKLIIFLVLSSILMLFFWYFISCFCAVYGNTQHILIEDTFISFGTSMLYPFGLKIVPTIFRIPALRAPKRDRKYLYKISLLLNKFL